MRIDRIEFDNALCFRHLTLQVDHEFQLIAGANNAGKSSLVRLLELYFSDPDPAHMLAVKPAHSYYAESGPRTLISVKLWFTQLSDADQVACDGAVRQDGRFWVAIRCSKAGKLTYLTSRELKGDRARDIYRYVLSQHHFAKIPSIRIGGSGDIDRPASLERLLDTLESILIRTGATRSTAIQQSFADKASDVEDLVKQVLDESASSIHSELPFQGGDVAFRMPDFRYALRGLLEATEIESGEGAVVPLAQRGTGFQSALVLGVLRYVAAREAGAAGNIVFAIEEPEAFLHPQTQRAMTQILRSIANEAQVLVTTHSPVVTDSVAIGRIARLPLEPAGMEFSWTPRPLEEGDEGRLSRYCTAGNSELIFANAAIFVEGFGDQQLVEYLLDQICTDPGGYFAQGITVIAANGLGNVKHLGALARRFGVRAHVLADKDGLRPVDGSRRLLDALSTSAEPPSSHVRDSLIALADARCLDHSAALDVQQRINDFLEPHRAFVMASDLEGLLIDSFGADWLLEALGPNGARWLSAQACGQFKASSDPHRSLGRKMGSKGWNADDKPTHKLEPHLPRILVADALGQGLARGAELDRLSTWLAVIVDMAARPTI